MSEIKKLQEMVDRVLAEAPKKKKESKKKAKDDGKSKVQPGGYSYAEALNFAAPLGAANLYARQGQVSWGPHTGAGTPVSDTVNGKGTEQHAMQSAWDQLATKVGKKAKK